MKIAWMLHELAKEADRVTKIGSRDGEVDQTADYLAIPSGVTHGRARVGFYFEVSIEGGWTQVCTQPYRTCITS